MLLIEKIHVREGRNKGKQSREKTISLYSMNFQSIFLVSVCLFHLAFGFLRLPLTNYFCLCQSVSVGHTLFVCHSQITRGLFFVCLHVCPSIPLSLCLSISLSLALFLSVLFISFSTPVTPPAILLFVRHQRPSAASPSLPSPP